MSILVTGGSGFIGSHTCLVLLELGYDVFVLDSFINGKKYVFDRIKKILKKKGLRINGLFKYYDGDIREIEIIRKVFEYAIVSNNPITKVIHFAGLKSVSESVKNPTLYWDVNVKGSLNLLEVMSEFNCKKIIHSSTANVYGHSFKKYFIESDKINPPNPYSETKAEVEKILEEITVKDNNWGVLNLRYFNPIGAHESGEIGEDPKQINNNLFPIILKVALGKKDYLSIYGNDWDTEDGTCIRDYLHIMDLVDAHIKGINFLNNEQNLGFVNINIGTGKGTTILNLVKTFSEVNNCKIPYHFSSRREGDPVRLVANNSLSKKILGWEATRSLDQMCKDGWNWINKNYEKDII